MGNLGRDFEKIDHFGFVLPNELQSLVVNTTIAIYRSFGGVRDRELESQISGATALAVHTDPWPVTV
jgi:hypothetical protein